MLLFRREARQRVAGEKLYPLCFRAVGKLPPAQAKELCQLLGIAHSGSHLLEAYVYVVDGKERVVMCPTQLGRAEWGMGRIRDMCELDMMD